MAFEMLKIDYKDDILNTSVNQLRRYTLVNNADGSISLIDITSYSTVGTFIGAKDINLICKNVNTIMGYIETSSGDLAQEFQDYFNEQKGIFEDNVEAYMQDFQSNSETQFTVWYDANTAAWSQDVSNRINAIIASLTALVEDNGPFVLNKAYKVGNLLTWNIGDGITRGYLVINPVPANMGIYPSNSTYFLNVTREGVQGVGLGMTPRGNWKSIITYVENDWVVHNWIYWRSKAENTDSEPSESNANWEKIYDITAEMPIEFEDPEENNFSFMEVLGNIISGQTLGNLFKYIKAALLKLLNKFKDTEYTGSGVVITYDTSNDSKAFVTKIIGATTVTKLNTNAEVSPDNPQTFIDAENFAIKSFGKNLYPKFSAQVINGITVTVSDDGVITLNGIATANTSIHNIYGGNALLMNVKGTYTLSINNSVVNSDVVIVMTRKIGTEFTTLFSIKADSINKKATATANGYVPNQAYIYIPTGLTLTNFKMKIQMEVGNTATEYEPFKTSSIAYTGKLGALTQGSPITNTIEYDEKTGVTKLVERWKSYTLDVSSSIYFNTLSSNNKDTAYWTLTLSNVKRPPTNNDLSNMYFNRLTQVTSNSLDTLDTEHFSSAINQASIRIRILKSRLIGWSDSLTANEKKNLLIDWVSLNPIIIHYELDTPIETVLDITPVLDTYEGTTVVTTNSVAAPSLEIYFKSRFWDLKQKDITSTGQDLDNYTMDGRFWIATDLGGVNAPTMDSGWLTVKKNTITDISPNEVVIRQDFEAALNQKTYYRYGIVKGVVTWGVWKRVLTSADIANNLLTTNPDMVLGADMGKVLNDRLNVIGNTIYYTNSAFNLPVASTWYDISTNITISETGTYLIIIQSNWVSTNVTNGRVTVRGYVNNTTEISRLIYDGSTVTGTFTTFACSVGDLYAGNLFKVRGWVSSAITNTANSLNISLLRIK